LKTLIPSKTTTEKFSQIVKNSKPTFDVNKLWI